MKNWIFTKCEEYDPLNDKANKYGMVTFWRGYNEKTGKFIIGETKNDVMNKAKQMR